MANDANSTVCGDVVGSVGGPGSGKITVRPFLQQCWRTASAGVYILQENGEALSPTMLVALQHVRLVRQVHACEPRQPREAAHVVVESQHSAVVHDGVILAASDLL